jgi:serine protease DegQ
MRRAAIRSLSFILRFAILGLAIAFIVSILAPSIAQRFRTSTPAPDASPTTAPLNGYVPVALPSGPVSYADAVARAAPAVVNIYANKIVTVREYRRAPNALTERLFGSLILGPAYKRPEQSLGSGVVFTADGYVLTNNHVISGADDIQVLLFDNRVAKARVIGADADTDLAVLKIDATNLPTIAISDRGPATVGDVVLAIGNPFGGGKTVTMGIVSATGRQLHLSAFEDFIQTDAAINSGNSGGALVNALGELVGINTAFYRNVSTGRGSNTQQAEGIGFAIPVSTAKKVLEQIISYGIVIRGWMGAEYADADTIVPRAPTAQHGVVLLEIYPGGPAANAGLRAGDVVLKLDGDEVTGQSDLRSQEAALAPGKVVRVEGIRDGTPFAVDLTLAQRPNRASAAS